jgi:PIN domain nuclease of toxin-antitoxin system
MRLLLDSHTFLWVLEQSPRLSGRAQTAIDDEASTKFVSFATLWELTIKSALGKLITRRPWGEVLRDVARLTPGLILPFSVRHLEKLHGLPGHHGDPFDRMLVAQALSEDLTMVSNDASLDAYGVKRIW